MSQVPETYRVLARKYRPQNFDDLIGQDALVRTLKNAIESGRVAHAFMLTGIRGVGKTTTARIIAKALNYTGTDGTAGPTTGSTSDCSTCKAIAEDRHPDVLEMDAASHTGVDDIREILDGVRYAPTSARYKIYIIDEVHMLSKQAFNALLKTLEEPPEHVKFIFATTEIRKVPITVLSRCQRFDLRRIEPDVLRAYYGEIAQKEGAAAENEALNLIARAADGSVRDGLSLLDQAIALGSGSVMAEQVKTMLGLADSALVLDVLESVFKGDMPQALTIIKDLYDKGADPIVVLQDMLEYTHMLTKQRAMPNYKDAQFLLKGDQAHLQELAGKIPMPVLARAWQMILKGLGEVMIAPHPQKAAEMILIRMAYLADIPEPADLVKKLKEGNFSTTLIPAAHKTSAAPQSMSEAARSVSPQPTPHPQEDLHQPTLMQGNVAIKSEVQSSEDGTYSLEIRSIKDIVTTLEKGGAMILASQVSHYVHLVQIKGTTIELRLADNAPARLTQDMVQLLKSVTGQRWMVSISHQQGEPTHAEQLSAEEKKLQDYIMVQPLMQNIMRLFPDAELKEIIKTDGNSK